ncbi:MAG: HU family DNA-binding protein [Bacteroides sp.]|nr:HU family DNA-binding protein [Bacteroides sp.]
MGERITLQNLIELFIEKSNLPKNEVDFFVRSFFVLIEKGLAKDGYVKIKGLGSFKLVKVEDRESVNVNTGERFLIEGHTKISFVPDGGLRELSISLSVILKRLF